MVFNGILLGACTNTEDAKDELGSIYGIVTEMGTAEPMKAVGIELYKKDASSSKDALLLKTVTFDDGHFEFSDLKPENYQVKVVVDGYEQTKEGYITVEGGRQARIDIQIKKAITHMVVLTEGAEIDGNSVTLNGRFNCETGGYYPTEVGFIYATDNTLLEEGTLVKCYVSTSFSTTLTGIRVGQYNYKAFAKNSKGIESGVVKSFTCSNQKFVFIDNLMVQTKDLGKANWDTAKDMCANSRIGDYVDWRLPTFAELSILYTYKEEIGGFKKSNYWSSSYSNYDHYYVNFTNGDQGCGYGSYQYYVRAVRTL